MEKEGFLTGNKPAAAKEPRNGDEILGHRLELNVGSISFFGLG